MNEMELWGSLRRMRKYFDRDLLFPELPRFREFAREPLLDVRDKGNLLEITAELPGIDKKDLNIELNERQLTLSGKLRQEKEEKQKGYYFKERKFERYFRSIPLPTEVIPNKSKADFRNGLLTLTAPKKHQSKKFKSFRVQVK